MFYCESSSAHSSRLIPFDGSFHREQKQAIMATLNGADEEMASPWRILSLWTFSLSWVAPGDNPLSGENQFMDKVFMRIIKISHTMTSEWSCFFANAGGESGRSRELSPETFSDCTDNKAETISRAQWLSLRSLILFQSEMSIFCQEPRKLQSRTG